MTQITQILEHQRAWHAAQDEAVLQTLAVPALAKCAEAIAVLQRNLKSLGYPWVAVERIPVAQLTSNVRYIETETGLAVPKLLVEFWKTVGGVSFVDLGHYRHVGFWANRKLVAPQGFTDGLHIDLCSAEWADYVCEEYAGWQAADAADPFVISLAPDGLHKDNISGGDPYGVSVGSDWKPIWQNFEWPGAQRPQTALADPPDFLAYLRTTILECAGFPGLLGVSAFNPIREKLLQGVPVF